MLPVDPRYIETMRNVEIIYGKYTKMWRSIPREDRFLSESECEAGASGSRNKQAQLVQKENQ